MKIKSSWCTEVDIKIEKFDSKFIKNVHYVQDDDYRQREVGEIDILSLPRNILITVFNNMDGYLEFKYKKNENNSKLTNKMSYYDYKLEKYFGLSKKGLYNLLKDYVNLVEDNEKYENFVNVLNSTCKLTYMDHDGYEYDYHTEHPHPTQKDVDHNYIGSFSFVVEKPISIKDIKEMKEQVELLKNKTNTNSDNLGL